MTNYSAIAGQSLLDVIIQTYGTIDEALKLVQDNNIVSMDADVQSRQVFTWDDSLVTDQALNQLFAATGVIYATDDSNYGNVFSVAKAASPQVVKKPAPIIPPPPGPNPNDLEMTLGTHYTSNADGTTIIPVVDETGNPITGCAIIQIELEIKPLTPAQWQWNSSTSILTLLNGTTLDNGQTAFILYTKTVTS